ncbi:threonine/serine exporter family protein [uncultured Alistipes sp.]|uniref:threonine/serine exporter family protein n=1 Tax=uncultured Alistipes sp. TaxID=538949 RepID=UPI00261F9E14|nr:threonine/serine exporter family protein [uncultured Alistipes sp.]
MIVLDILLDGLFAAVAAIGFSTLSDPPRRAFPRIALLAAIGHALRFCLMQYAGVDIATASFAAALAIGFGSLWLGRSIRCPMTVLYIPALLPMIPGIYAYKAVFSLILFLQALDDPTLEVQYMQQFFLNATVSLSVIALLASGATLPIFIFNRQAFSLTRKIRRKADNQSRR